MLSLPKNFLLVQYNSRHKCYLFIGFFIVLSLPTAVPLEKNIYLAYRLQYVGSTTTDFRVRFRNHKSATVTKKKTCEVAVHFNKTPHNLSDFSFQCIDQVQATVNNSCNIDKLLITKEAYWSAQLFSLAPFGLNKRQEFHSKNRINYN